MAKRGAGKTALISGASRGIGKGIALTLASEGYDLSITHFADPENAEQVAQLIENQFGTRCLVLDEDLAEEDTPGIVVEQTIQQFGHIDVLVNNAGITIFAEITKMKLQDMNRLIHLDFRGPMLAIQAVSKHMIEKNIPGSIINITSTRSERAYPYDAIYGGVKAALARATQSIALELAAHHIRVNCIAPGMIAVRDNPGFHNEFGKKIPLERVGTPDDVGQAVAWLVSDEASYITGTTLRVDGGLILPGMPEDISLESGYGWGKRHR